MIIDTVRMAGLDAYFKDKAGRLNLGGSNPLRVRTKLLGRGEQLNISSIELLIESDNDLAELFKRSQKPLLSLTVMKEMFPQLFADPFQHRVHNIAGFEDFKRGMLKNGKVMDVEGIPTIVSVGSGTCVWNSPIYQMASPIKVDHAAWELAASTKTLKDNFKYSLDLDVFDHTEALVTSVKLADSLDPTKPRKAESLGLEDISFYRVKFAADVARDAFLYEKHSTLIGESVGTPLLRAVNLLEPVESIYHIFSLQELLSHASEYHLFEFQGQPLRKMIVALDVSATLVCSDHETIFNNDPADRKSLFEFVEIEVKSDRFSNVEARSVGEVLWRPVPRE